MEIEENANDELRPTNEITSFTSNNTQSHSRNIIPNINLPDQIEKAKLQGFEGEPCPECQNFTLVRNGTCLKCNTCGATTGCS